MQFSFLVMFLSGFGIRVMLVSQNEVIPSLLEFEKDLCYMVIFLKHKITTFSGGKSNPDFLSESLTVTTRPWLCLLLFSHTGLQHFSHQLFSTRGKPETSSLHTSWEALLWLIKPFMAPGPLHTLFPLPSRFLLAPCHLTETHPLRSLV